MTEPVQIVVVIHGALYMGLPIPGYVGLGWLIGLPVVPDAFHLSIEGGPRHFARVVKDG